MFRRFALYGFEPPNPDKYEQKNKDGAETRPLTTTDFDPDLDLNLLPKRFGNSTMLAESIPIAEYLGRPLADHPAVKYGRPPGALRVPREPLDATTVAEAVSAISCWYAFLDFLSLSFQLQKEYNNVTGTRHSFPIKSWFDESLCLMEFYMKLNVITVL